jgi:hypothetical protein
MMPAVWHSPALSHDTGAREIGERGQAKVYGRPGYVSPMAEGV